ncbi:MAG: efflux transporter outer membrane subunit [Xanthomonadaceae bacterium]|nr:efflux transporter outer membrane subunit [Xanthomonadaceae bacterium]
MFKVVRYFAFAALVLASAACTLAPRYERPASPIPDEWSAPLSGPAKTAAEGESIDALPWREFVLSPKLERLIELALENNRDLRIAALNVERARGLYRIQRSELLPNADVAGSYTRQRVPPTATFPGREGVVEQYSASVGAAFELDFFGRLRSLNRAALEDFLAQESSRRSLQISLIAEVAQAFLVTANDLALKELAEATVRNQDEWFALTQERHRLGAASGLELNQAQTQVESARADAARYEGDVARDLNALRVLVGTDIPPELMPASDDAQTALLGSVPVELPSQVLLNRPDILAAEHTLRAANANIGAARAAFFPRISLTGSAGYISNELSDLFDRNNRTWSFVPQLSVPIFQGGRLKAGLDVAHVDREIALARYEQAIQIGFQEVSDALALTGTLTKQLEAQERLVGASARAFELSQARREAGQESYLTLLDAQRSYYGAQQGLIATRLAEQANLVALYRALGGGWERNRT